MTVAQTEAAPTSETTEPWLTAGRFAWALALLIIAAYPGVVLGKATFVLRDFGLFGYPLAYFHRQSFWRGELPLWNPLSNCGLPFLAQWNTLTLYPGSLIYLLLPLQWSLSLFCLAHQFWGGLGMFVLARQWTGHRPAAAVAGVIFSFNGLALSFLLWPNMVAAYGWLPWVVWLAQRAWQTGGKLMVLATLAGAMQMLSGGPETVLFTWLLLLTLAIGDWLKGSAPRNQIILRFAALVVLIALVCAAQLLPFLQLLSHSQRDTGFRSADWAMPPWGWANFLVPLFRAVPTAQGQYQQPGQYWTASYYAGAGTVFLAVVAVWRKRDWRVGLLAALTIVGLILALGDRGLVYGALHSWLPGFGLARYPVKFVILALALAPLLAAFGLATLDRGAERFGQFEKICGTILLLVIAITIWVGWRFPIPGQVWSATWQNGLVRAGFLAGILIVIAAWLRYSSGSGRSVPRGNAELSEELAATPAVAAPGCSARVTAEGGPESAISVSGNVGGYEGNDRPGPGRRPILLTCLLLLLFWLDFVTHMPNQNPGVRPSVYAPGWASQQIEWEGAPPKPGESRLMLAPLAQQALRNLVLPDLEENYLWNRLAFFADCNLLESVPQVYGFFSLTPREAYRATMLPYIQVGRDFPALLDFLAVSQTTAPGKTHDWVRRPSALPFVTAGQQPVFTDDDEAFAVFSQTNADLRQIVLLPAAARAEISAARHPAARAEVTQFANERISIRTESAGACLVVLSQTFYPAWKAWVDGRSAKIWRGNYAFQAIEVPAGTHRLELRYEDRWLAAGVVLSCLGSVFCSALWTLARIRKRVN